MGVCENPNKGNQNKNKKNENLELNRIQQYVKY